MNLLRHSLLGEVGLLRQLSRRGTTALWVLDADDEASLILDAQVLLDFTEIRWNGSGVDQMGSSIFGPSNGVYALGDRSDWIHLPCTLRFSFILTAFD